MVGLLTLAFVAPAYADPGVQASGAVSVLPSDADLTVNEVITLTVRFTNTSTNTPPPNFDPVPGTLTGTTVVKLGCVDSPCTIEAPGTLMFQSCAILDAGVATCGLDGGDFTNNTVNIVMTGPGVAIAASSFVDLVTITVKAITPIVSPINGQFFTRAATGANDLQACEVPATDPPTCATGGAAGSATLRFPAVCGDGIVNRPAETCDTNPLNQVPGAGQCCPSGNSNCGTPPNPAGGCPAAIAEPNLCRPLNDPNPCTICGDGVVQAGSGEACDDGNDIDGTGGDPCTNDCQTTTTSTSTSTSSSSSSSTSTSTSTTSTTSTSSTSTTSSSSTSTSTSTTSTTSTSLPFVLNHFQCYEIRPPQSFPSTGVSLVDQFGEQTAVLTKAMSICAPADKRGESPEAVTDPAHLASYQLQGPRFERLQRQVVSNQFGDLIVDVIKPARLLVPTSKSLEGPASPLAAQIDHFTCYKVKRSRGTPRFVKRSGVSIETQFESTTIDVVRPLRLCAPTSKNGETPGVEDNLGHLLCYRVRAQVGFPSTAVNVLNQFGAQNYILSQRREFCVPSLKNPGYGSPSRAFLERVPDLLG